MRISDWSSDVCSSDLRDFGSVLEADSLDARQHILSIVAVEAGPQVGDGHLTRADVDPVIILEPGIIGDVIAGPAIEHIVAAAADQPVIPVLTVKLVRARRPQIDRKSVV